MGSAFEGLTCQGEGANLSQNVARKLKGKFKQRQFLSVFPTGWSASCSGAGAISHSSLYPRLSAHCRCLKKAFMTLFIGHQKCTLDCATRFDDSSQVVVSPMSGWWPLPPSAMLGAGRPWVGSAGLAFCDLCLSALWAAEWPGLAGVSGRRGLQRPRWREPALLGLPGSLASRARVRQSLSLWPENERRHCDSLHFSFQRHNVCLLKDYR